MIIKLDAPTVAKLKQLQKSVHQKTGMIPQSISLMVQVLVNTVLESIKDSTLQEIAPSMLTLSQQRNAAVNEMIAFKEQLNVEQIKSMMKTLEKLKQNASKKNASPPDDSA
jgi:hypothetical protein